MLPREWPAFPPLPLTEHPFAPALPEAVEPTVPVGVEALTRALPTIVQSLAPGRYKVQFTASAELRDKLERLRGLMLSQVPGGDLGEVIDRAVTETLERLEARRYARSSEPRKEISQTDTAPTSRHLPAAVKRVVYQRDGGRCRYVDTSGRRCAERSRLEYHHRLPFGMGATIARRMFRWCVGPTTSTWPTRTTGGRPWRGTDVPSGVSPLRPDRAPGRPAPGHRHLQRQYESMSPVSPERVVARRTLPVLHQDDRLVAIDKFSDAERAWST